MTKIKTLFISALLLTGVSNASQAYEIGITGLVAQGGVEDSNGNRSNNEYDYTTTRLGLLVDNPLKTFLNYRFSLGFERNAVSTSGGSENLFGLGMTHTFAFNVFKTPKLRIWIGPQFRAVIYKGDGDRILDVSDNKGISYGIGPETGLSYQIKENINISSSLALISGDLTFDEFTYSTNEYDSNDVNGSTYGGHFSFAITKTF